MTVSQDEKKVGVALGVNVIKDIYKVTQLAIYCSDSTGKFSLEKECDFEFDDACITFYFNTNNTEELYFFTMTEVFKFNYMTAEPGDKETIYELENELSDPPRFGVFSPDQTKFIVTSNQDILYVDMKLNDIEKREIDFDDIEEISAI